MALRIKMRSRLKILIDIEKMKIFKSRIFLDLFTRFDLLEHRKPNS